MEPTTSNGAAKTSLRELAEQYLSSNSQSLGAFAREHGRRPQDLGRELARMERDTGNQGKAKLTRKHFSISMKLKILRYADRHGIKAAAERFEINRKNIDYWSQDRDLAQLRLQLKSQSQSQSQPRDSKSPKPREAVAVDKPRPSPANECPNCARLSARLAEYIVNDIRRGRV